MTGQGNIDTRAIDWRRWASGPTGSRVTVSPTAPPAFARAAPPGGDRDDSQERRFVDDADALPVAPDTWRLRGTLRILLRIHYVVGWSGRRSYA